MTSIGRIALVTCFFLYRCQPIAHSYQPPEQAVANPKMIFLTFSIQADSVEKNKIQLIGKKEADGPIKGKSPAASSSTHLVVSLVDRAGQVLLEETIEHPLLREVEYTNDKNEFERKALNLKNAEFFVRMKLPATADRVLITEVIKEQKVNSVEFNIK